jgi:hypothetical protein
LWIILFAISILNLADNITTWIADSRVAGMVVWGGSSFEKTTGVRIFF